MITKMKNSLERLNSRFVLAREQISTLENRSRLVLNQDGRVEGHALTPSCENTRITTSYWTIINRKTLELTK